PERRHRFARPGRPAILAEVNLNAFDSARIGVEDFSLEWFGPGDEFAANRHMAGLGNEITAKRVDFLGDVADIELAADRGAHIIEVGAAIGQKRPVALLGNRRALLLVVLIGDVADDAFD